MMARMASADIMCVGNKSVREKFSGIIRYWRLSDVWRSVFHFLLKFFLTVSIQCRHSVLRSCRALIPSNRAFMKITVFLDRQQDVRATEIDKVDMHSSFRIGDIVRALVVSFSLLFCKRVLEIPV